jgi:hypothetical protein
VVSAEESQPTGSFSSRSHRYERPGRHATADIERDQRPEHTRTADVLSARVIDFITKNR